MARIKHIAIATGNPEATAKFYIEGLGMKQVGKLDTPTDEGYYLTDGYINLAILKFKTDEEANTEGGPKYTGMHHFGFNVETMPDAQEQIIKAGAVLKRKAHDGEGKPRVGNVEVKFIGPDGITIDLSETGWVGQKEEDAERDAAKQTARA